MERYGNIRFTRRMVVFVCMLVVAVNILMPKQIVFADAVSGSSNVSYKYQYSYQDKWVSDSNNYTLKYTGSAPVYSYILEYVRSDGFIGIEYGFCSKNKLDSYELKPRNSSFFESTEYGVYFYVINRAYSSPNSFKFGASVSDIFCINPSSNDDGESLRKKVCKYVLTGEKSDGMIIGGSDTKPTAVTNESIGYLQDVKLNLSYITPIKGDSIFETTNYQIYTDMIYNLKWNGKKTSTNYDLSSSYVQLYAKAEYRKSEFDDVTATDFIELGDYEKASKGKLKFSYMELFKKSNNCKSAYLSAFPLSSADYKNGKLQACSVTSNIKYKFYIRVFKGTDKGPWLCVSERGSHISNEFVNSGDDVKYNVSSGGLSSDGSFTPDGNVNENGTGTTGTGKDVEDADADTNANDKIQSKHDSSDNSVWDNLENLVSGIASVPIIIKDIFSFLPSWCLNVTATGFALMITVCVIRFVRGK